MIDIPFTWEGKGDFHNALYSPIQRASLTMLVGRPSVLFLWHTDGSCLRIANKMHDLGDRVEVGSLSFGDKGPSDKAEFEVDVCVNPLHVEKLILVERNVCIESGVAIALTPARELIVVSGAYPYTLAVDGLFGGPHAFEPEYQLSRYRREEISK
jgi:hypothetical protein